MTLFGEKCSICRSPQESTAHFIRSKKGGNVCDDCATLALFTVADSSLRQGVAWDAWIQVVRVLPDHSPLSVSTPVLTELLQNARTDDDRRYVSFQATRLCNTAMIRRAQEAIPEASRTAQDRLNHSIAYDLEGDWQRANELLSSDDSDPWITNSRTWVRLHLPPEPTPAELEQLLAQLDDAQSRGAALREVTEDDLKNLRVGIAGTRASVLMKLGRFEEALKALEPGAVHPPDAEILAVKAKALSKLGREAEAKAALEDAKKAAHPESRLFRELSAGQ